MNPATMMPVHDHYTDGGFSPSGDFDPLVLIDEYEHDPRCPGDCGPCGGVASVDIGVGWYACPYCSGTGRCSGCNLYNRPSLGPGPDARYARYDHEEIRFRG